MSKRAIGILYFLGLGLAVVLGFLTFEVNSPKYGAAAFYAKSAQERLATDRQNGADADQISTDEFYVAQDGEKFAAVQADVFGKIALSAIPGGLLSFIAWFGALLNLGRAQEWALFTLVFLFSGIMLIFYLLAGPQPPKTGAPAYPQQRSGPAASQAFAPDPGSRPPAAPAPLAPLEVLQHRYARGEIDTATYDEMRSRLEPPAPGA